MKICFRGLRRGPSDYSQRALLEIAWIIRKTDEKETKMTKARPCSNESSSFYCKTGFDKHSSTRTSKATPQNAPIIQHLSCLGLDKLESFQETALAFDHLRRFISVAVSNLPRISLRDAISPDNSLDNSWLHFQISSSSPDMISWASLCQAPWLS